MGKIIDKSIETEYLRKRGNIDMSNKERAIQLLDQIPESKMYYIIGVLEGAAIPDETPNAETLAAIDDVNQGRNLSKPFHSVEELMEDLNA